MQYLRDAELAQRTSPAVANAWMRYLVAVRNADSNEYEEIEGEAWSDLLDELLRLGRTLVAPGPDGGRSLIGR